MSRKWSSKQFVPALALAALVLGPAAQADLINFNLTTGNPAISGFPGPYASVQVDRTSSTQATITFTGLTQGSDFYRLGGDGAVGINVNATTFTLNSFTGTSSPTFSGPQLSNGGAGNEDGFGSFNQTINEFDGYGFSLQSIALTVTDVSGTWADAAHVLTANNNGALAAAHIYVSPTATMSPNGALATGFAAGSGGSTPPTIPEPMSLTLLGVGLLGLGMVMRRRH